MAYNSGSTSGDWATILEPESAANTQFRPTDNNVIAATKSGLTFEMDDTNGRERIRLNHRSGTFVEMHPNGDEVHKIYGDGYEIVISNKKVKVYGSATIVVDKDAAIQVKGNASLKVGKSFTAVVEKNIDFTSKSGSINLNADEVNVNSKGGVNMVGSTTTIPGSLAINGNLKVQQKITAGSTISTNSTIFSLCGFITPGSLVIGPMYANAPLLTAPQAMFLGNYIMADTLAMEMHSKTIMMLAGLGAVTVMSGASTVISGVASLALGSAGAVAVTAGAAIGMAAVGAVSINAASVNVVAAATTMSGIVTVAGLVTAADFFCIVNPTFYSAHLHATLVGPTTPPVPGT
jgi:hypothetical protein